MLVKCAAVNIVKMTIQGDYMLSCNYFKYFNIAS